MKDEGGAVTISFILHPSEKGQSRMRFVKGILAVVLVASLTLGGTLAAPAPAPQTGGASAEREQGRALLHRGRAAEALVLLERALKAFQQSGDRSGEASTQDLLGELYDRQGRYDLALEHYRAAQDLYAGASPGGRLQTAPAGRIPGVGATASAAAGTASALTVEESGYNARLVLSK